MRTLQPWHDFFLLSGGSAATLMGLVFVAASIAATVPDEKLGDEKTRRLWVLPIVWAFLRVLVVSALGLIPEETGTSFGTIICAFALLDLARMARLGVGLRRQPGTPLEVGDWGWYFVYPFGATLAIGAAGLSLARGWSFPPPRCIAAGMLGHLVTGVHNAWELADWLATRQ